MKQSLFIILITAGLFTTGCQKFLDVNKNPNNPTDVQESLLLAPIEQNISDNVQGGNASIIVQNFLQNKGHFSPTGEIILSKPGINKAPSSYIWLAQSFVRGVNQTPVT